MNFNYHQQENRGLTWVSPLFINSHQHISYCQGLLKILQSFAIFSSTLYGRKRLSRAFKVLLIFCLVLLVKVFFYLRIRLFFNRRKIMKYWVTTINLLHYKPDLTRLKVMQWSGNLNGHIFRTQLRVKRCFSVVSKCTSVQLFEYCFAS